MTTPIDILTVDALTVLIYGSEADLGRAAAVRAAERLRQAVADRGSARAVLATGNSQLAFTSALGDQEIPWQDVVVFHMDEYVGIGEDHPASFRRWMRERVAGPFGASMEYIIGDADDAQAECDRYERLLRAEPLDLVCMGIGENGHLAFNEPDVADFDDERWVRIIELSDRSRVQQVGEGHFPGVEDVPQHAISLTIPALLSARQVQVCAPEARKAQAVAAALHDPVSPSCPATALRTAGQAVLFLEPASAPSEHPGSHTIDSR